MFSYLVRRALAFYLDRTKQFWKSPRLFISIADRSKESMISAQKLSRWISGCIVGCCDRASIHRPQRVKVHSLRSQAMFVALLKNLPVTELWRATIWLQYTFSKHYTLILALRSDAVLCNVVLSRLNPEAPPHLFKWPWFHESVLGLSTIEGSLYFSNHNHIPLHRAAKGPKFSVDEHKQDKDY